MQKTPPNRFWFSHPIYFLACGFGTGLLPKAPGTFGTLVGIPFCLLFAIAGPWGYWALTVFCFFIGVFLCAKTTAAVGVNDHPSIVWDEIVGYLIAVALFPKTFVWLLLGFLLFRYFDIAKPWPVSWFDQKVKNGLGIMLDDVVAGFYAMATLYVMNLLFILFLKDLVLSLLE